MLYINIIMEFILKISILIPTYNRETLILRALQSVKNQTFSDYECIILDDCSTDMTKNLILPFIENDPRFKYYLNNINMGCSVTKNKLVQLAEADIITFLDSDDEYLPDHIESRYEFMTMMNIDILYGNMVIVGDEYVIDKNNHNKMIHIYETSQGSTLFIKKKVMQTLGGYNNMYGEDGDLLERAIRNNFHVQKFDKHSYIYYRDTPNSITSKLKEEKK